MRARRVRGAIDAVRTLAPKLKRDWQGLVMRSHIAFLSAAILLFAADRAVASDGDPSAVSSAGAVAPRPWLVRAEGSLVEMHDNWLAIPAPELGLTIGRDLTARFFAELTGSMREPESNHRSWSALAAIRWAATASESGRHALTIAVGPYLAIANPYHGTLPFAHAELAYVYRAAFGLTVLVGGGPNIALASSPYLTSSQCPGGRDSNTPCGYLSPDAQEIHAGDANVHLRLAVGWQF